MFKVIFINKSSDDMVIKTGIDTTEECSKVIRTFLDDNGYTDDYYWRMWKNPANKNQTMVDFGSHLEFFAIEEY